MTIFVAEYETSPIIAVAIHNGHDVRPEIAALLALSESERLREEDPFTGEMTEVCPMRLIGLRSRFEVDLNRPRDKAFYLSPEDCWGLDAWQKIPSEEVRRRSLAEYDLFYDAVHAVLHRLVNEYEYVAILDLHSYNHRRDGCDAEISDAQANPEVNVGTGTMNRRYWAGVVDRFIGDLRGYRYFGRQLDVRENVKFFGGNLCRWVHETYPTSVCALAIEVKKFFMDEWTGEPDRAQIAELIAALRSTLPGLRASLQAMRVPSQTKAERLSPNA